MSLAALEALARAPREVPGEQALALGRLEALQALADREDEDLEWFEGFEEGAALARDAARARHARALALKRDHQTNSVTATLPQHPHQILRP